jgi:membrane protease subunit (stomatin/prohibitin family)
LFLNTIVGRQARYTTADIQSYLRDVIVSRLNDLLGEQLDSILDLPAIYTELAEQFKSIVKAEFEKYGLKLVDFFIASITPPDEVAKMIDQRSGLEAVGDLDNFLKFQLAKGLGSTDGTASAGAGMGMAAGVGFMMPGMMANAMSGGQKLERVPAGTVYCTACGAHLPLEAKFCFKCGHKQDAMAVCPHCNVELVPGSRFCGGCGKPVNEQPTDGNDTSDNDQQ